MAQVVLDIVYKTKGMQGLAKSQQELNKASRAANTGANSIKKFDRAVASAGRSSRSASAGVKAFGAATVGATGSLKAFGAAMASYLAPVAAIAAAVGALAKSMQIAGEREADARALANGLQKIGAETAALESLQAAADRLGKTTLLNQEDFTKGFKLLTSFRNIALSSYEEVATAAADMSAVLGNDLNSNLLQLSKALEDPAKGLTYLSRSGTTFTEQQKEMIKSMQEAGNLAGAQAEIMKVLEAQYGGAAEAAGKSGLAGAFDSMMEVLRDAGEVIGKALEPLAVGAMQLITAGVQALGDVWAKLQTQVFPGVKKSLDPILKLLGDIYKAVNWEAIAQLVGVVLVGAFKALEFALKPVLFIFEQMLKGLKALMESPVGQLLGQAFNMVAEALGGAQEKAAGLNEQVTASVKPVEDLKQSAGGIAEPIKSAEEATAELKKGLEESARAAQQAQSAQVQAIGQQLSIAQAVLDKELAINDAKKQAAEADLAAAQTAEQRLDAINRIYEASVTNARLQYEQTMAAVEAEIAKKQAALGTQLVLQEQVQTTVALQRAQGIVNAYQDQALQSALQGVQVAQQQLDVQLQIAREVEAGARARYEMQVGAAETLRQQQLQEQQQHATNAAIGQGVQQMNALAAAASAAADQVARATGGGGGKSTTQTGEYKNFIPAGAITGSRVGSYGFREDLASGVAKINHPRFGAVTYDQYKYLQDNPTHGLKHYQAAKTAEREEQKKIQYEINHGPGSYEGSQRSAPSRSLGGGGSAPAVNVNYSGSTLSFNGDDYVSKGDVNGIVGQAVGQTMKTLSSSSGARLRAGLR